MADWDEDYVPAAASEPSSFDQPSSEGRSFGKGRGFAPVNNDSSTNDGWNTGNSDSGGWGGGGGGFNSDRGDRRGRGGRGGRGNRDGGDRGGFNRRRNDDSFGGGGRSSNGGGWADSNNDSGGWGGDKSDSNSWGENRRGGRGGGRRGGRDDDSFGGGRSNGGDGGWGESNDAGKSDSWNDKGGDSWGSKDGGGGGYGENRRGRGGGRGGRSFGRDGDGGDENGDGPKEERPPIYVPKERTEEEIFDDAGISKGINFDDYKNINVNVSGSDAPPPISRFEDARLRSLLMDNVKRSKYEDPTPIQKHAIPIVLAGRDLMATAQTGSGKTAAFLLPIVNHLLEKQAGDSDSGGGGCQPYAIVISPTRELTTQIYEVARKFCTGSFLKVQQVYGGTSVGYQMRQLQNGCHILIATPGRLGDFLNRNVLSFSSVKFVVLDEADRMLDMGFHSEMEKFLNHETMSKDRQTLLFSATFSENIQKLAGKYLKNYIFLAVGIVGGACKDVEQNFVEVDKTKKKSTLMQTLQREEDIRGTLVFVEQKRNADFVASYLSKLGHPTTSIHGDRFQPQREEALRDFKSRKMSILVATSVAARGLDIKGVTHVINYDLPKDIDEYVHRIGRTGRLGNKGKATSFYDRSVDSQIVNELVQILKQAGQPVPDFLEHDATGGGNLRDDQFGAYDYRSKSDADGFKTDSSNMPTQIQDEAEW